MNLFLISSLSGTKISVSANNKPPATDVNIKPVSTIALTEKAEKDNLTPTTGVDGEAHRIFNVSKERDSQNEKNSEGQKDDDDEDLEKLATEEGK